MKKIFPARALAALCLFAVTLLSANNARAQQTLGSINGTVTDISGAAVPGAKVTIVSNQTGLTRLTKTQKTGYWEILNIPIGTYKVTVGAANFQTTNFPSISVQEMRATTINASLKPGEVTESVTVSANPLLNATDTTNGYSLDKEQIQTIPLATGSFTQLAVLAPGVSAELLSGMDTNAGLGNRNIWANGQRATSNTFQVNGVDASNIFNGMSSSGLTSQRYNFNIGSGSTSGTSSAGAAQVGGASPTGTSVYGSTGNSLPSPPPEFLQEMRVNTSMYDAQQGETSGAQIDANTSTGTNKFHGQIYGTFANNGLNAAPYFFKQDYLLSQQGTGAFPKSLENPGLQRWTTGATAGGPIIKNKLFFFLGYQRLHVSDESTGLTQMSVPTGLTNDRSPAGIMAAATTWQNDGKPYSGSSTIDPIALKILQAKLPDGSYMIPSAQAAFSLGAPNVTLIGNSIQTGDQATAAIDYNVSDTDRLSAKYYYQQDPVTKIYGMSTVGGFPQTQKNGSQVFSITNTNTVGSRMNWTETLGYDRMYSYSSYQQTVPGGNFGINSGASTNAYLAPGLPGLLLGKFGQKGTSPGLKVGPYNSFANIGFYQNRLNPSANVIFSLGKHTLTAGGGYSYTQLNIENNRDGIAQIQVADFSKFLAGSIHNSYALQSIAGGRNNANRYYRTNEIASYLQDKWQALPNLSITAGVRYDYHGGLTEKYGNIFNFDPGVYKVTGTTTSGFTVDNPGFVVAGNNKFNPTPGVSASTLNGRQWGLSPRVGFAWSPKTNHGTLVLRGGFGLYYDRGELFSYLSQPAGSGIGGPFGVTESAPLVANVSGTGSTLEDPLGDAPTQPGNQPSADPTVIKDALQATLNNMTGSPASTSKYAKYGRNCGGVQSQEGYFLCPSTLTFGAYDSSNVLPYSMNFTLNTEWQPTPNVAITIGYTGNRGRHEVIPMPLNEPRIATTTNPVHGEQYSYGFEVLNQNNLVGYDYAPIANEPWNSYDGGNTDFRAPYVGYSPNAAMFRTVGNSAYDALETHIEKRLSHHFSGGLSYTFSHTYDEQSDVGLFFTGSDPANLRQSYAHADFDRTHVLSANFNVDVPNLANPHGVLAYATNNWHVSGTAIAQSGQPYSLYEFYGAVGSINFGDYPSLMNPVLPIKDPAHPKSALTGNKGDKRGPGGSFIPAIDPSQIAIHYIQPGQSGVPVSTGTDPQDIYETPFAPGQRNIFRQAFQKQLNLQFRKDFHATEKVAVEYRLSLFNITNTPSLDVPNNQTEIRQVSACSTSAYAVKYSNCADDYINYGQIATSNSATDQASARTNLDQMPTYNGTGKNITIPVTSNGADFGSVTNTIGSSRMITMGLHIMF